MYNDSWWRIFIALMILGFTGCSSGSKAVPPATTQELEVEWTKDPGTPYGNGIRIIKELDAMRPDEAKKLPFDAFRDQVVAFDAAVALPGASNDLVCDHGVYLRVVNPENKDLRPHAVAWRVFVQGKILQVLAENKIIVIEVDEKDWQVKDTW